MFVHLPNLKKRAWFVLVESALLLMLTANVASAATLTINGCVIQPGTQCPGANLSNVKLANQHLENANLQYADLSNTDLTNAHLEGANLQYALLAGTDLDRAHLLNTNLFYATDATREQMERGYLCATTMPDGSTVWHVADCKHCASGK